MNGHLIAVLSAAPQFTLYLNPHTVGPVSLSHAL